MGKFFKKICICVCTIAFVCIPALGLTACTNNTIVVASKDFTEQDVLGNIIFTYLSKHTDYKFSYKNEMSSNIVFEAIKKGSVDLYVDYTGTVYGNYLGHSEVKSAEEVYDITKKDIKDKYNLEMLSTLGFNNTYTLSVAADIAREHNLETFSDLAKISNNLIFGGTFEILNRNDGIPGLEKAYSMQFKEKKSIDGTLRYIAIDEKQVDVIDAFATDALLLNYDLVTLKDDKNFFPPYFAVPIIRADTAEKYPELVPLLEKLENLLTDEDIRGLNYKVDVQKQNAKDVAEEFLKSRELI